MILKLKKTVEQIKETRSWFFEKMSKIDKPLAALVKKKRERTQINEITSERGEITTQHYRNTVIREYYEKLYANKLDNLEEMDKFLETHKLPKLRL